MTIRRLLFTDVRVYARTFFLSLLMLLLLLAQPAAAYTTVEAQEVIEVTGTSCIAGGAVAGGLMILGVGGALGSYAAAAVGSSAPLSGFGTTLVACGTAAAATLSYYTGLWSYEVFIHPPLRPQLVYPPLPERP